jgi:hypothetical protein
MESAEIISTARIALRTAMTPAPSASHCRSRTNSQPRIRRQGRKKYGFQKVAEFSDPGTAPDFARA